MGQYGILLDMSELYQNAIFWIETEKIVPNPYQPRREFDDGTLEDLADSIRQYGVLQPLVVTRIEHMKTDGAGMAIEYELIAGERRLRASRIAGLKKVPVVVRVGDTNKEKLELAIIENLQREDLNPIDRAEAFLRLADEFSLTHAQVGKKVGKSREYVSNTLRLLSLPDDIQQALQEKKISEGHTRPLMMLSDRPEQQQTLFKEIMYKKMSVRESEKIARKIAHEKVRKEHLKQDPELRTLEQQFSEKLGTRVSIEKGNVGGKLVIDYFSRDDLEELLHALQDSSGNPHEMLERFAQNHTQQTPSMSKENSSAGKITTDAGSTVAPRVPDTYHAVFDFKSVGDMNDTFTI